MQIPRRTGLITQALASILLLSACGDAPTASVAPQRFDGEVVGPLAVTERWRKQDKSWFTRFYADNIAEAPIDRLIIGPIDLNTNWTTVTLQEPLTTVPFGQELNLLLSLDLYAKGDEEGLWPDDENYREEAFYELKRRSDGAMIANRAMWGTRGRPRREEPVLEVILIDRQGEETPLPRLSSSGGWMSILPGKFHLLSYRLPFLPDSAKLGTVALHPKEAHYTAIKLRSRAGSVRIEHLLWEAPYYYRNPNKTWEQAEATTAANAVREQQAQQRQRSRVNE